MIKINDIHSFNKSNNDKKKIANDPNYYLQIFLKILMKEIFLFSKKNKNIAIPQGVSFGFIYDKKDHVLFKAQDKKTGKKLYLYNLRIIMKMFNESKEKMLLDTSPNYLFTWVSDVCILFISPYVYDYVINRQHRGKAAAERTTNNIVKSYMNNFLKNTDSKQLLDLLQNNNNKVK